MKYVIKQYPNAQGEDREQRIEADKFEETDNGNVIFKKDSGEIVGMAGRGSFEFIKKMEE